MKQRIPFLPYLVLLTVLVQSFLAAQNNQNQPIISPFACKNPSKKTLCCLSQKILGEINTLEQQLETCCSTLENRIAHIFPCGPVLAIGQSDIPINLGQSGYVCLKEDVLFDGSTITSPGYEGPIAIAAAAQNLVIDLDNHTLYLKGAKTNGIATIGTSAHVLIKNGTIVGSTDSTMSGILILTDNVTVQNVRIINFPGSHSSGISIQGALLPSTSSPTITYKPLNAVLIDKCDLDGNYYGIELNTFTNGVIIKDSTIDNSVHMGITQPARTYEVYAGNVFIDNCTISNSGLNGIYTTYYQANWQLTNCKISNSGLNGMILAGFQNLLVRNCQVFDSGAHGIIASIRQSQNVEIDGCQIFNAQDTALRVDNVANLIVRNSQFSNYNPTSGPLVKLQDIFSGAVSGCIFNSAAGTSDGLFLRNCHGLTIDGDEVLILCNQGATTCPIGINLQGDVDGTVVRNCTVSGNPLMGIALQSDTLNGVDTGVIVENNLIKGALSYGIFVSGASPTLLATNCGIYGNKVVGGASDGIHLDANTAQCSVRDNSLINNAGFGINDLANSTGTGTNRIYHNFAQSNKPVSDNYQFVPLVTGPTTGVGVLENISN